MNKRINDWMNEWMNEWMNKWMNEWMCFCCIFIFQETQATAGQILQGRFFSNFYFELGQLCIFFLKHEI